MDQLVVGSPQRYPRSDFSNHATVTLGRHREQQTILRTSPPIPPRCPVNNTEINTSPRRSLINSETRQQFQNLRKFPIPCRRAPNFSRPNVSQNNKLCVNVVQSNKSCLNVAQNNRTCVNLPHSNSCANATQLSTSHFSARQEQPSTVSDVRPQRKENVYVDNPSAHTSTRSTSQPARLSDLAQPPSRSSLKSVSLPPLGRNSLKKNLSTQTRVSPPFVSSCEPPAKQTQAKSKNNSHNCPTIMCKRCNRCQCNECKQTRTLPSTLICGRRVTIGADSFVDCCSGLLCVQLAFSHCCRECLQQPDDDDSEMPDCVYDPCACFSKPHCGKRWLCMILSSLCLPCLCCYWPGRGCLTIFKACYNKSTRRGCQCSSPKARKRLLVSD